MGSAQSLLKMLGYVLLTITVAQADIIYKCERDGQTTFSQHACAEDAEEIEEDDLSGLTGAGGAIQPAVERIDTPPDDTASEPSDTDISKLEADSPATTDVSNDRVEDSAEIARQIRRLEADAEQRILENDTARKHCIVDLANNPPEDPDVNPNTLLQACRNRWTRLSQKIRRDTDETIEALKTSINLQSEGQNN